MNVPRQKSWLSFSTLSPFLVSVIAESESWEANDEPLGENNPSSRRHRGDFCGEQHLSSRDEGWSRSGVLWLCFCSVSVLLSPSTSTDQSQSRQRHDSMSQQQWTTSSLLWTTVEGHHCQHRPASVELEHRTSRSIRTLSTRSWWWWSAGWLFVRVHWSIVVRKELRISTADRQQFRSNTPMATGNEKTES